MITFAAEVKYNSRVMKSIGASRWNTQTCREVWQRTYGAGLSAFRYDNYEYIYPSEEYTGARTRQCAPTAGRHLATAYRQVVRLHQWAHACRCNYGPLDGKCEENWVKRSKFKTKIKIIMYICTRNYDLKRGGTFETAKAGTFHSVTAGTSIPLFT